MSALTTGVHHIGLTVPDIHQTCSFFVEVLGFAKVAEKPDYPAVFVSDGTVMLTLWQTQGTARDFDRKDNVGLHHLALCIAPEVNLDDVHDRLVASGLVEIEFAPEALPSIGARHLMCAVPGGIRLELLEPKR